MMPILFSQCIVSWEEKKCWYNCKAINKKKWSLELSKDYNSQLILLYAKQWKV